MSSELVKFLLTRIAEDEAVAKDIPMRAESYVVASSSKLLEPGANVTYWARDRALAECEAKRRILTGLSAVLAQSGNPQQRQNAEATLGHLAAVYADHPDYRQEWRP